MSGCRDNEGDNMAADITKTSVTGVELTPAMRAVLQHADERRRAVVHHLPMPDKPKELSETDERRALRKLSVRSEPLLRHTDTRIPTTEGYDPTLVGVIEATLLERR